MKPLINQRGWLLSHTVRRSRAEKSGKLNRASAKSSHRAIFWGADDKSASIQPILASAPSTRLRTQRHLPNKTSPAAAASHAFKAGRFGSSTAQPPKPRSSRRDHSDHRSVQSEKGTCKPRSRPAWRAFWAFAPWHRPWRRPVFARSPARCSAAVRR